MSSGIISKVRAHKRVCMNEPKGEQAGARQMRKSLDFFPCGTKIRRRDAAGHLRVAAAEASF